VLDWNDFRLILALGRERTLSAAARRLGVDQSTASRRLATLEAGLGAPLFERTPNGYVLSLAGEAVLGSVEEIEERALSIERRLAGRDTRVEGRVRLATSDSFATWFLLRHLSELRRRHPGLVLELVTGNQPARLAAREADLSLRLFKPSEPNLVAVRLGAGAWAAYAARGYVKARGRPALRARCEGHDLIGFESELATTVGARWLATRASGGRVVLSSNSLLTIGAAVVAGLGVSALPCLMGDREPALVRVTKAPVGAHDIWLVVHPDVRQSARIRAVMDYLKALVGSEQALLLGKDPRRSAA
jgi:DNA-binding transcriptional LysR family regulator